MTLFGPILVNPQCECCGKGSVEIKCPYKFKDCSISEGLKDPYFCLNADMTLKQSSLLYLNTAADVCYACVIS